MNKRLQPKNLQNMSTVQNILAIKDQNLLPSKYQLQKLIFQKNVKRFSGVASSVTNKFKTCSFVSPFTLAFSRMDTSFFRREKPRFKP